MRPGKDIEKVIKQFDIDVNRDRDRRILDGLRQVQAKSKSSEHGFSRVGIGRIIMQSRTTKLAIAAIIIIAVLIGLNPFGGSIDGVSVAFGDVLKNSYKVQSFHALLNSNYEKCELWGKRGNKLRIEYSDGKYEISNGPVMWQVDKKKNKAIKKDSFYYKQAQRKGVDVLDYFLRRHSSEGCSGFFAEEPVEQIKEGGMLLNLYKTELEQYGNKISFEAKVNAKTNLLEYMKYTMVDEKGQSQISELKILEYDATISDQKFAFKPDEGMDVTIHEAKPQQDAVASTGGSTLSGRIVWAKNNKPVSEAILTIIAGKMIKDKNGRNRQEFFKRTETDRNGYWTLSGIPEGNVRIIVRSWELDWPAIPEFTTNIGNDKSPAIVVDGKTKYENLDFKVYKPQDFFARITINVVDENGDPIEGVGGNLSYVDGSIHGHVYAKAERQQFTGKNGRFDADNIWPSKRPVKLHLWTKGKFGAKYATRQAQSEPFIIEPKGEYHFDITLPFVRKVKVRVLGKDGKPVKEVSVSAINNSGMTVFPFYSDVFKGNFTDKDGFAAVSGLAPGEEFFISVQRLDSEKPDPGKPVSSAIFKAAAASDKSMPLKQVVFDERPVRIEGYCLLERPITKGRVVLRLAEIPGENTMPYLWEKIDESGKFTIDGVPATRIKLKVSYVDKKGKYVSVKGTLQVSSGNNYRVKVTEKQIVIEDKGNLTR